MKYTVEVFDDENFEFMRRHIMVKVEARNHLQALEQVRVMKAKDINHLLDDDFYIAQISRPFDDCELEQPVYDILNGSVVEDDSPFSKWSDLMEYTL